MTPAFDLDGRDDVIRRSLTEIRRLKKRVAELEGARSMPVAVVGAGCRLPGGVDSPQAFWQLLIDGRDAVREVPADRWDANLFTNGDADVPGTIVSRHGGFLDDVTSFAASFFGIAPREARSLDPQHRLLLEVVWEALEHAAIAPDRLHGTRTGIFVGICSADYYHLMAGRDRRDIDAYMLSGSAHSTAAGRLSYTLGLQGPSLAIDTACSSSLAALHLAVRSLRSGESETAIVGGVNLILSPEYSVNFSRAHMLSPDGLCKAFDAAADGFGRAEGCVAVILKRLPDALRDHDRVLAVVRGTALNQDGRTSGLTVPNGPAQQAVIRMALADAGLTPGDIQYVEAHGTGTALGDPIEIGALGAVFRDSHATESLRVGSAKTNIGHAEGAAGLVGFLKTVLMLQHARWVPHLHFTTPNPHIDLEHEAIVIPAHSKPWIDVQTRRAGVSSFGFSGTNAHAVLEAAPAVAAPTGALSGPHIFPWSAQSSTALAALAHRYCEHLAGDRSTLAAICESAACGRATFDIRAAVVAADPEDLRVQLKTFTVGAAPPATRGDVAFLFTGQGAQQVGMAADLYQVEPSFRADLDQCAELFAPHLERPLLDVVWARPGAEGLLDRTQYTQPALFAVEVCLARLWRRWGIEPDIVLGHSIGELAAACVAGVFSLEDGVRLVAERGRLMGELPTGGCMAAVMADEETVRFAIGSARTAVAIAAVNGPENTVIAGTTADVHAVVARLQADDIESVSVTTSHAFHSSLMEPMLERFRAFAETLVYHAPEVPIVSNLDGRVVGAEIATADYWTRHIRETVQFHAGLQTIAKRPGVSYIEIGPKPVLTSMGRRTVKDARAVWLASLRPGQTDRAVLLNTLAALYRRGATVVWDQVFAHHAGTRVSLPTYPFEREHFWFEASHGVPASNAKSASPTAGRHPLATQRAKSPTALPLYEVEWVASGRGVAAGSFHGMPPSALARALRPQLPDWCDRLAGGSRTDALEDMERAAARHVIAFWVENDIDWRVGNVLSIEALETAVGVADQHRRLLGRLIAVLVDLGHLSRVGNDRWRVESLLAMPDEPAPAATPERRILDRCGRALRQVLRGGAEPLDLLFPADGTDTVEAIYRGVPGAQVMNRVLAEALRRLLSYSPTRPLSILEVGGGTGSATRLVLDVLQPGDALYTFTDVSPLFVARAQATFASLSFLDARLLDVEKPPAAQGFREQDYDIVIASNVVHATRDIQTSLRHLRGLLRPGGELLLLESLQPRLWADLVFGLTSGWWRFADLSLRPKHALCDLSTWTRVLSEVGFEEVDSLAPDHESVELLLSQGLIVARTCEKSVPARANSGADVLILGDPAGLGQELARRLQAHGCVCTMVTSTHDLVGVLRAWSARRARRVAKVITLWGCQAGELACADDIALAVDRPCESTLALLHAVLKTLQDAPPEIWTITRDALSAGSSRLDGLAGSALQGMIRVAATEHPEMGWHGCDLPAVIEPEDVEELAQWLAQSTADGPTWLARRDGAWLEPRLRELDAPSRDRADIRADAAYLVTGGLSGIGLAVAKWLVARGARHLLLLGRRAPASDALAQLDALRQTGAAITVVSCDVADASRLTTVLHSAQATMPAFRGVFHAAGIYADIRLADHRWEDNEALFAAKVRGSLNLHFATAAMPLDYFVLFSSVAAILGVAGLGSYVAACSFLDALATHRRRCGMPGLSVNWGMWRESGMAASIDKERSQRWQSMGLETFSQAQGLDAMERLMSGGIPCAGAFRIDWQAFLARVPGGRAPAFYNDIAGALPTANAEPTFRLQDAPAEERPAELRRHLRSEIADVLGWKSPDTIMDDKGFFDLGMDSLTSLDLRNRLQRTFGISLASTIAFKYSTVNALAAHLLEICVAAPEKATSDAAELALNNVSDQGVERLTAERLVKLQATLS